VASVLYYKQELCKFVFFLLH